jgi:hypothetical protein
VAYYPQSATGLSYQTAPTTAGPTAVTVTASGSTNTKGIYATAMASATATSNFLALSLIFAGSVARYLLDVAIGAAASEVVVIPNLVLDRTSATNGFGDNQMIVFPLAVASGARIACRVASSAGSATQAVVVTIAASGDVVGIGSFVNYGATTADSGGIAVDPGAVIDTKGAYSQLTASTSAVAQWMHITVTQSGNTTPAVGAFWSIDIATGAAASEVVLIPSLIVGANASQQVPKSLGGFLTYIATSTRIAARASCSNNDATDRLIDVAILAGTAPVESSGGGAFAAGYVG